MDLNRKRQITFGTLLSYFTMFMQIIMSIVTTPFIVNKIGDSPYGVYKIVASFVAYMSVLNFGLGTAGIRYISEYRITNQREKQYQLIGFINTVNYIISLIIVLTGIAIYYYIPMLFSNSMTYNEILLSRRLFVVLIICVLLSMYTDKYSGIISAYEQFAFIKMIGAIRPIIKIILIFSVLSISSNAIFLAIIDLALNLIILVVEKTFCLRKLDVEKGKLVFNRNILREYKEFLLYALGIFISMIINQLLWNVDSVLIGVRLGAKESAIYAVGTTFSSAFFSASIVISNMLLPKVVRMQETSASDNEYTIFTAKIARIQAFIIFYMYIAFLIYGKEFIYLWMGKNYEDAWTTAFLVMTGTIFSSLVISVQVILRAQKRQTVYNTVHLIIFLLNAVLTYFAIGIWGINGAALMTFFTYFFGYCFVIYPYYYKYVKINVFYVLKEIILKIVPVSVLICVAMLLINKIMSGSWLIFVIKAVIYTIIYFIGMYFVMNEEERKSVNRLRLIMKKS